MLQVYLRVFRDHYSKYLEGMVIIIIAKLQLPNGVERVWDAFCA